MNKFARLKRKRAHKGKKPNADFLPQIKMKSSKSFQHPENDDLQLKYWQNYSAAALPQQLQLQ